MTYPDLAGKAVIVTGAGAGIGLAIAERLAAEGCNLVCPYHGYEFDVRSGACLTVSDLEVETFEVKIVENAVCVAV